MKTFIAIVVLCVAIDASSALDCKACNMRNDSSTLCDFNYTCPAEATTCQTLLSKVEGFYSLTASCATDDKCGNKTAVYGFDKCNHLSPNTECYDCCEGSSCNDVENTLAILPAGIFSSKKSNATAEVETVSQSVNATSAVVAGIPEIGKTETVKKINATVAETTIEAAKGETKVVKTNETETEDEPEEVVEEVKKLIAADEKRLENGESVGGDKIALGNDTTDNEQVIVNTSNLTANATDGLLEIKTILFNDTTEEEDLEYLDFTTEASIVNTTGENEFEIKSDDYSVGDSDNLPGDKHALTQGNSAGIMKAKFSSIFFVVSFLVLSLAF